MKLDRTEIGVIIAILVVIVTINAWWRVKEIGRQTRMAAEHEGPSFDAGLEAE